MFLTCGSAGAPPTAPLAAKPTAAPPALPPAASPAAPPAAPPVAPPAAAPVWPHGYFGAVVPKRCFVDSKSPGNPLRA